VRRTASLAVLALAMACSSSPPPRPTDAETRRAGPPLLSDLDLPPVDAAAADPDGEDDNEPSRLPDALRALAAVGEGRWVPLGPMAATAHPVVCDLIEHDGALYASHARSVINRAGSRIHRFRPADGWELAFDYDGPPGGQGLPRIRAIGGRLIAVDSDSTSAGFFGLSGGRFEAYLFVADEHGSFAPIRGGEPPAGIVAIRDSLHSFDVIEYRGRWVASGGTGVFAGARARWPGALWAADPGAAVIAPRHRLGFGAGVVRTTFFHRYGGRLYVGFQNNEARARFDLAVLSGDPLDPQTPEPALVRVTTDGGWLTRRFASGGGELFWIASGYHRGGDRRPATLFRSRDGLRFEPVGLPAGAGPVQDMIAGERARFVLTRRGLFAGWRGRPGWRRIASAPPGDPFGPHATFCSAPMAIFAGGLVAGSLRDGRVFRLEVAGGGHRAP
jgi:hypothetical protein